jgi:glycosyltransferase involved in cell wall biosynthesis
MAQAETFSYRMGLIHEALEMVEDRLLVAIGADQHRAQSGFGDPVHARQQAMAEKYVNIDETPVLAPSPAWHEGSRAPALRPSELKVLHVITGVTMGGAEMMLFRLLARGDRDRFSPTVLSLLAPGAVGARISAMDVPLLTLGMRQERPLSMAMLRLIPVARSLRPSLIQGWMYHGNLAASGCALLSGRRLPVIWNVRHSIHDMRHETRLTRGFIRLGAALSSSTRAIIYNSRLSASQHEALGYDSARTMVIPNGFDCQLFRPRPEMAQRLRDEVRIDPGRVVIGMIARNHPHKDPGNLIKATALLAERGIDVHVVIVGPGFDAGNPALARAIGQAGIAGRVSLLGQRHDIPDIVAGLDIAALSSSTEAFPNVLGEAMACGVPCVATDVGDSGLIVGHAGIVVPPRDSEALADALGRMVALGCEGRRQLGAAARARVIEHYEVDDIVGRYQVLYERCGDLERSPSRA